MIQQDAESESGSERSDSSSKENRYASNDISPVESSENPAGRGRRGGRRCQMEFGGCVYVGSLPNHTRVSEFKAEVRHHNVNPLRVLWRGNNGFAFLNFRTLEDAELALEALHGLKVTVKNNHIYTSHIATHLIVILVLVVVGATLFTKA